MTPTSSKLILYTEYPGGIYEIEQFPDRNMGEFSVKAKNSDPYKITEEEQVFFMYRILYDPPVPLEGKTLVSGSRCFKDIFVSLEDLRNITYGTIDCLIEDITLPTLPKVGGFGFLCGDTKPYRMRFMEYARQYPDAFEYISTNKFSKLDPTMISFLDMKKYKYLIDLPGHTYSTKLYSFLHMRRVIFRVEGVNREHEFYWEKWLEPWVHYIPVSPDFSDLVVKYREIEENPILYDKIVYNCQCLIQEKIDQRKMVENFLQQICRVGDPPSLAGEPSAPPCLRDTLH